MPHHDADFQHIQIEKALPPVPDGEVEGRYYLPILLSSIPPEEWMKEFCYFYDSCAKFVGERILQYHDMPFSMALPSGQSSRKRDLAYKLFGGEQGFREYDLEQFVFFQYSIKGQGPHPDTQASLKNSCENANKEYRKFFHDYKKIHQKENQGRQPEDDKQKENDCKAQALVRDWFKD
ncbi:MAG: hypothetical protein V1897_13910 [Pseudomonadota bacterium]